VSVELLGPQGRYDARVIDQVVVGGFGVLRCGKVHSIALASLLHAIIVTGQPDHSRVELCDMSVDAIAVQKKG
jgi:hypothetical protein